jgi:hypothetical protein
MGREGLRLAGRLETIGLRLEVHADGLAAGSFS